jgi:hypothetical protein
MIIDELANIVGPGNVLRDPEAVEGYSRDLSFVNPVRPACVVKPGNAGDVEKIVKLANETRTPLVPVSSGPPRFRGDTVPAIGGAIIVDLSGLKKVMRVDRKNRTAVCEPGVTFGELAEAVEKEGLRLNMPLLPRRLKSVVASMLEREPVTMPKYHWDISDPLNCVEVVFGTGEVFRTGAAAGPGTIEEQWRAGSAQREAAGPTQASFHRLIQGAQGTMGIVTWASLSCELLPTLEESFFVCASRLDGILELVHWLVKLRLVNECFVLGRCSLAAMVAKERPNDFGDITHSLPPWALFFTIAAYDYLPKERVSYQTGDMMDAARRTGLEPVKTIGRISAPALAEAIRRPAGEPYWKVRHKGSCQDIFFLTTYDKVPALVNAMFDMAHDAEYPAADLGIYLQPLVQGTNCHGEFNLFYDPEDPVERGRVRALSARAVRNLMAKGAFFSRPYGESAGMIMNRDAATVAALKKVKAVFDPKGIMNPGKLCF